MQAANNTNKFKTKYLWTIGKAPLFDYVSKRRREGSASYQQAESLKQIQKYGRLAQLVAHHIDIVGVTCSSHVSPK